MTDSWLPVAAIRWLTLEQASKQFRVSQGWIVEQIKLAQKGEAHLRRRVLRTVEERWLIERWLVAGEDLAALLSPEPEA